MAMQVHYVASLHILTNDILDSLVALEDAVGAALSPKCILKRQETSQQQQQQLISGHASARLPACPRCC